MTLSMFIFVHTYVLCYKIYIFETFDVETDPFQNKLNGIIFNCIVLKFC
jgi:hypothetical protein